MIKITFPDNSVREYAKGTTAMQIAESISSRLAQEVLAASVNGEVWDLSRPINDDATVKLLKWEDEEGNYIRVLNSVSVRRSRTVSIMTWIRVRP